MIEGKEYKLKKDIITPEETIPAGTVFDFSGGIGEAIGSIVMQTPRIRVD